SHQLLRREFSPNGGYRVLARGGIATSTYWLKKNQLSRSLILARPTLAHASSLSPPGAPPAGAQAADPSVMKVRRVVVCHSREATGPVWCQPMDGVAFRTRDEATMNRIAYFIEMIAFSSRWLVAPFLLGLIFGLAVLLYKFVIKLVDFVGQVPG